jgi:actin-related protein
VHQQAMSKKFQRKKANQVKLSSQKRQQITEREAFDKEVRKIEKREKEREEERKAEEREERREKAKEEKRREGKRKEEEKKVKREEEKKEKERRREEEEEESKRVKVEGGEPEKGKKRNGEEDEELELALALAATAYTLKSEKDLAESKEREEERESERERERKRVSEEREREKDKRRMADGDTSRPSQALVGMDSLVSEADEILTSMDLEELTEEFNEMAYTGFDLISMRNILRASGGTDFNKDMYILCTLLVSRGTNVKSILARTGVDGAAKIRALKTRYVICHNMGAKLGPKTVTMSRIGACYPFVCGLSANKLSIRTRFGRFEKGWAPEAFYVPQTAACFPKDTDEGKALLHTFQYVMLVFNEMINPGKKGQDEKAKVINYIGLQWKSMLGDDEQRTDWCVRLGLLQPNVKGPTSLLVKAKLIIGSCGQVLPTEGEQMPDSMASLLA